MFSYLCRMTDLVCNGAIGKLDVRPANRLLVSETEAFCRFLNLEFIGPLLTRHGPNAGDFHLI